jgi:hypothetical protein
MAKTKGKTAAQAAKPKNGLNKMDAMRKALADLGYEARPLELQKHLKAKYATDMDTKTISSYKSTLSKQAAAQSAVTRKPAASAAVAPAANSGITVEDIKAVKELAERLGADKVKELAEVLGR